MTPRGAECGGELRVLHVNLAAGGGVGRYGAMYARALERVGGVSCRSVYHTGLCEAGTAVAGLLPDYGLEVGRRGVEGRFADLRAIRRLARRFRPHIIHDTAGSANWMGALLWPALSGLAPLVITEHDPVPHSRMAGRPHERLARWMARRSAARLIVHGRASAADLTRMGVAPDRIHMELHGSFGALLTGSPPPREPRTVLFFGTLRPNKGVDWLPAIADAVVERVPDARFVVAGAPPRAGSLRHSAWPEELASLLDALRARAEFELHIRHVPDNELVSLFGRAAVTLLPYRDATQSGVAMIALPAGSAVVATAVGNLPDVIRSGETGVLVAPDAAALADAVAGLLAEPARALALGEAGREFARTSCAWDVIARRTVAMYRTLLRESSP